MTSITSEKRKVESPSGDSILLTLLKYIGLFLFDAFALVIIYTMVFSGNVPFAVMVGLAVVVANVVILVPGLYPIRWMVPGLVLLIIFVLYPIVLTVYTAFTNLGSEHPYAKQIAIQQLEKQTFVPADAQVYRWTLFRDEEDPTILALWLSRQNEDGTVTVAFAPVGAEIVEIETTDAAAPEAYEGYVQVPRAELGRLLGTAQSTVFGIEGDSAQIRSGNEAARPLGQRYVYDAEQDAILDQESGTLYPANYETGYFESNGTQLIPGFQTWVGAFQFTRFFSDPRLQGPLITIFIWTVMFAGLSVFTTFSVGLFLALILNDARLPGKKIIRSLLIIPYAMPGVISILVWRGMLNEQLGIVTNFIEALVGFQIPWFSDAMWSRAAIVLVNLWLGYPYMMLICSGALQAIPSDIYEAAAVDGATPFTRFFKITLPLLLVTVGPLLIASFVYNFNNFMLIEALTAGNPPIPNSPTVAGYTDILISYVYRLAFGGRGAEYGYASAITIVIFLMVAGITLFQSRITKGWEEVSENV
jgi:ABC-type sugar transport system permease subunit